MPYAKDNFLCPIKLVLIIALRIGNVKETTVNYCGSTTDDLWTARIEEEFENLFGLNISDIPFVPELKEPVSINGHSLSFAPWVRRQRLTTYSHEWNTYALEYRAPRFWIYNMAVQRGSEDNRAGLLLAFTLRSSITSLCSPHYLLLTVCASSNLLFQ